MTKEDIIEQLNLTIDIENPKDNDAVSREAVLQAVSEGCQEWRGIYGRCEELINALPSVTQNPETVTEFADRCRECGARYGKLLERKSGKWMLMRTSPTKLYGEHIREYQCSECYRNIRCTESQLVNYPYCHCGARMESEEINGSR